MKLDILVNDGSPIGVTEKSINGEDGRFGVGGAELALLTLCRGWHEAGHDVTLYNDPSDPNGSAFRQEKIDRFRSDGERDVIIIFRSPNNRIKKDTVGLKVWWSCDQYTIGNFSAFSGKVDKIVTISQFHADFFKNVYGIENTTVVDLPVRTWEYLPKSEKIPYKCIFNSIPDRGLMQLAPAWEKIVGAVPEAHLYITSDWRLWKPDLSNELTRAYKLRFAGIPNVHYLGPIKRIELVKHEMESDLHLYPCIYDELFCISVAETQVAGALPITSSVGAVGTTNMGVKIEGSPYDPTWINKFSETAIAYLKDKKRLEEDSRVAQQKAIRRFSPANILEQWDKKVFLASASGKA